MQTTKKRSRQTSKGISKRTLPSGQTRWQVYLGRDADGKQRFKLFEDRNEAETHLENLGIAKANEGQQLWSLTPEQRGEAARRVLVRMPQLHTDFGAAFMHGLGQAT